MIAVREAVTALVELEDLADRAREYARDSKAAETRRAHAGDIRHFERWCERRGVRPYPLDPAGAALYLTESAQSYALASIDRRRRSIITEHKRRGYEERPFSNPTVDDVWHGIRRSLGVVPIACKDALLIDDLRKLVAPLGDELIDLRDRALLLLGFAGAFRRSEIVSLDVEDVRDVANGIEITLRRSKTDQEGAGRLIGIPYGSTLDTCPVRAVQRWREIGGIVDGPLFRAIDPHRNVSTNRLGGRSVALIVKRRAEAVDLDPDRLGGHSLRAGFATSAALAGVSETFIAAQTGHRSMAILRRYIRPATVWQNNAAAAVGL